MKEYGVAGKFLDAGPEFFDKSDPVEQGFAAVEFVTGIVCLFLLDIALFNQQTRTAIEHQPSDDKRTVVRDMFFQFHFIFSFPRNENTQ
jgi:hypothetical protein